MIQSKDDLKEFLKAEKELYYSGGKWRHIGANTKNHVIFKYIFMLRHEEYYKNVRKDCIGKVMYLYWKRRKNTLGHKLGFDIPANCFDIGLQIFHVGGGGG